MPTYSAWSQDFTLGYTDLYTLFVEESEWRSVHDEYPDAKRLFAEITVSGGAKFYFGLGHPVAPQEVDRTHTPIYLPPWVLLQHELEGVGEPVQIQWCTEEYFPEATRIVLRPHDSAFYNVEDQKEELEQALGQYGILRRGSTVPVLLKSLGKFEVYFDVVGLEPAELVLMQGDEVAIEFEEALDSATLGVPARPPTPPPLPTPVLQPSAEPAIPMDSMIPLGTPAPTPTGHILGGTTKPRLADGRAWNPWRTPQV